ncbi:MAG: adenylate/guanylate cyclase domain-containing protein [Myxococcota bacterium]
MPLIADEKAHTLVHWLVRDSTSLSLEQMTEELCTRLIAAGVPVWRMFVPIPTLHPEVFGRGCIWKRGGRMQAQKVSHDFILKLRRTHADGPPTDPVAEVERNRRPLRRRLNVPPEQLEYGVYRDVQAQGGTDYLALPLYIEEQVTAVSWATDAPGGFSDENVALLTELMPFLEIRLRLESARFAMDSLLEVYLGHNAARRVSQGVVRRGTGERIAAAIWFCDLRGFTTMADGIPPDVVVKTLDSYFERVGEAVLRRGGEILKFIGDAILAIFPVGEPGPGQACDDALRAAREALEALAALNRERATEAQPPLAIGVALHLGEVMYGNIGARERLDFTVIGASVNEVCRLESLCKPLGTPLIISEALAERCSVTDLVDLGAHALKGVSTPRRVFGLRELVRG